MAKPHTRSDVLKYARLPGVILAAIATVVSAKAPQRKAVPATTAEWRLASLNGRTSPNQPAAMTAGGAVRASAANASKTTQVPLERRLRSNLVSDVAALVVTPREAVSLPCHLLNDWVVLAERMRSGMASLRLTAADVSARGAGTQVEVAAAAFAGS